MTTIVSVRRGNLVALPTSPELGDGAIGERRGAGGGCGGLAGS